MYLIKPTQTRIKIFESHWKSDLETEINNWLEENDVSIKEAQYNTVTKAGGYVLSRVFITYTLVK